MNNFPISTRQPQISQANNMVDERSLQRLNNRRHCNGILATICSISNLVLEVFLCYMILDVFNKNDFTTTMGILLFFFAAWGSCSSVLVLITVCSGQNFWTKMKIYFIIAAFITSVVQLSIGGMFVYKIGSGKATRWTGLIYFFAGFGVLLDYVLQFGSFIFAIYLYKDTTTRYIGLGQSPLNIHYVQDKPAQYSQYTQYLQYAQYAQYIQY